MKYAPVVTSNYSAPSEHGSIPTRDVRGGAFSSGAGRGEDENPRGGPRRGGAKKRVNQMIWKFYKSA